MGTGLIIGIIVGVMVLVFTFVLIGVLVLAPVNDGSQGPKGEQGIEGNQGSQGIRGPKGVRGDLSGDTGITGDIGPQGFRGHEGMIGLTGSQGFTGNTGMTGINFISTFKMNTDTVFSLNPGFNGFTAGTGDDIGMTGFTEDFNLFDRFTLVAGTNVTLDEGKYAVNITYTADSKNATSPSSLQFYIKDNLASTLDSLVVSLPPNYLTRRQSYTVPLYIDTSTSVNLHVKNNTVLPTTGNVVAEDFAIRLRQVNATFQGFDF